MTRLVVSVLGTAVVGIALVATGSAQQSPAPTSTRPVTAPAPAGAAGLAPAASHTLSAALSARQQSELVKQYCAGCHSDRAKAGGLSLAGFDAMQAQDQQDVVEKMIRKLSAGLMPPPGARKPEPATLDALTGALESRMDEHAASNPNPGRRTFQRLNRPEYERAIQELLGLEVDGRATGCRSTRRAPTSTTSPTSSRSRPTLLEAYLNAAADISRMAVGDRQAARVDIVYTNPSYVSQHPWDHVEGAPYGTRGGLVVNHVFPADAEYEFELLIISGDNAPLRRHRHLDRRRARGAAQVRERAGGGGRRPRRHGAAHRADLGARRRAPGVGGVRAPQRRPLRRPDPPARLVVRGRRIGRRRHHDPAAPARPGRRGPLQRHRRVRDAEPPADLHLPAHGRVGGAHLRPLDPRRVSAARPTAGR